MTTAEAIEQLRAHGGESHRRDGSEKTNTSQGQPGATVAPTRTETAPAAPAPGPPPVPEALSQVVSPELLIGIGVLLGWLWLPWLRRLRRR